VTGGAVRIGTAGWSIPSRYLNEIPAGGTHLLRYARVLTVTEINSSFHRPHRVSTYERWAASVGDDFRFCVKLPKALTHEGALVTGASEVRDRFLAEVAGLGAKLAVLLVQLPPSLAFDRRAARAFFSRLRARAPASASIACEPRHPSWRTAAVDELLSKLAVSRVAADPARWEADARPGGDRRLAYFRLHGSPRLYFSTYEPERLEQLRHALQSAARESDSVWCIFDNTAHGHALGNALWMQQALRTASRPASRSRRRSRGRN